MIIEGKKYIRQFYEKITDGNKTTAKEKAVTSYVHPK